MLHVLTVSFCQHPLRPASEQPYMPESDLDSALPAPPGFQARFVAELLTARAPALSEIAAAKLVAAHPGLALRYQPLPREKWAHAYRGRLVDLAAALFSERPEIFVAQISWARAAFLARGAPIDDLGDSLAVLRTVLAREVPPEDAPLVDAYIADALRTLDAPHSSPPTTLSNASPHGKLAAAYLLHLLEGDRLAAAAVVIDAVHHERISVRSAYLDILVPVQQELGRMWHLAEINIAEEHFATAATLMVMSQLLPLAKRRPRDGRVVLVAAVEGNTHDLGVRLLADFFDIAGWRAIYLGASVPADELVIAATDFRADLIALSAALVAQLPTLESTIRTLRESLGPRCPRILIGGCAFCGEAKSAWHGLGADAFAANIDDALSAASNPPP